MQPRIVQIVPTQLGGVRDYAEGLAQEWAKRGIDSELLPFDEAVARAESLAERLLRRVPADEPVRVLLHFSGYGYSRRALAFWLLRELSDARRRIGARWHLVGMVHELFASGPPWRSAFWLGALQARVVHRLAGLCDRVVTNSEHHAAWLRAHVPSGVPVRVAPVFSNMGEPADIRPATAREPALVVFGSASTRARAFDLLGAYLGELRALHIQRIVEAGPGPASRFSAAGMACSHVGEQTPAQLEELLQRYRYGLIDYPSFHLGKSGVFAAYAANGCIVLDTAADAIDADGLRSGRHYLSLRPDAAAALKPRVADAMSRRLRTWYLAHRRGRQATEFLDDLLR